VFIYLQLEEQIGRKKESMGIGFEIYDLKGNMVDKNKRIPP